MNPTQATGRTDRALFLASGVTRHHFSDDPIIADDIADRVSKAAGSNTIQRFPGKSVRHAIRCVQQPPGQAETTVEL